MSLHMCQLVSKGGGRWWCLFLIKSRIRQDGDAVMRGMPLIGLACISLWWISAIICVWWVTEVLLFFQGQQTHGELEHCCRLKSEITKEAIFFPLFFLFIALWLLKLKASFVNLLGRITQTLTLKCSLSILPAANRKSFKLVLRILEDSITNQLPFHNHLAS